MFDIVFLGRNILQYYKLPTDFWTQVTGHEPRENKRRNLVKYRMQKGGTRMTRMERIKKG